jgi:hypothetical protein
MILSMRESSDFITDQRCAGKTRVPHIQDHSPSQNGPEYAFGGPGLWTAADYAHLIDTVPANCAVREVSGPVDVWLRLRIVHRLLPVLLIREGVSDVG